MMYNVFLTTNLKVQDATLAFQHRSDYNKQRYEQARRKGLLRHQSKNRLKKKDRKLAETISVIRGTRRE